MLPERAVLPGRDGRSGWTGVIILPDTAVLAGRAGRAGLAGPRDVLLNAAHFLAGGLADQLAGFQIQTWSGSGQPVFGPAIQITLVRFMPITVRNPATLL